MKRIHLLLGLLASILSLQAADYSDFYKNLPVALQQPATVHIPDNTVRLTDFGAIGDGITLATDAFRQAFDKLEQMGGGRLIVPEGIWLTGPISMRSNTELHLDDNAIIMMSPDKRLFVNPKKPNSRCLSGITAENCIYNCKRVLLKDITVQNSPRFHVHPYYCEDMIIDGIKVRCPWNRSKQGIWNDYLGDAENGSFGSSRRLFPSVPTASMTRSDDTLGGQSIVTTTAK